MAKTGFWLRGAKGKLAGTTLYKGKQGTVQREIVTPTNPQTHTMMAHRALFAECAKFYSNGMKAFFKFAFERKPANLTDFNAFMKANVNNGAYLPKSVVESYAFPMIGNFLMTDGSLGSLSPDMVEAEKIDGVTYINLYAFKQGEIATQTPTATIGDVSRIILGMDSVTYQAGDIVTIVFINGNAYYPGGPLESAYMVADEQRHPEWNVVQFYLDVDDDRNFAETVGCSASIVNFEEEDGSVSGYLEFALETKFITSNLISAVCAGAVVISRNSPNGLMVTTSRLLPNWMTRALLERINPSGAYIPRDYVQYVATSWGAKGDAVLKGSIAKKLAHVQILQPVVTAVFGADDDLKQTYTAEPSAFGEECSDQAELNQLNYIRIVGANFPNLSVNDFDLSGGTVESVACRPDSIIVAVSATTAGNRNLSCSALGGVVCKVNFQ